MGLKLTRKQKYWDAYARHTIKYTPLRHADAFPLTREQEDAWIEEYGGPEAFVRKHNKCVGYDVIEPEVE